MPETRDYQAWHRGYDEPGSGLAWRLREVRRHLGAFLDQHLGEVKIISICAGDGRDVVGVLAGRDDAARVEAVLLELDPVLADRARDDAAAAGLTRIDVRTVDAARADAYRDLAQVDVVIMVGIFGNVADTDVSRLIDLAPRLCRNGAVLLWSRGRRFGRALPGVTPGDLNDEVRAQLVGHGFSEIAYETHDGNGLPALGVVRYDGPPVPLLFDGPPLFTFLR